MHDVQKKLMAEGLCYIKGFLTPAQCDRALEALAKAKAGKFPSESVRLNDSADVTNTLYESKRSPLHYIYLRTPGILAFNRQVIGKLNRLTGLSWKGNINDFCLPMFQYEKGGFIKPHRGRNVGYGENVYVTTVMLTKPGRDFTGGRFFINKEAVPTFNGKEVIWENPAARMYFNFDKGDALVFFNLFHVHGTELVESGFRVTTSWRTRDTYGHLRPESAKKPSY